ncbi:hypothetical protein LPL65_02285 [Providencia huaxiensis]|uniref:phage tail fiber protein n=1 Tax=Providencia huaxiensis TaxID=2027290 RepID=UPI001E311B5C|nr:hypothetical protein [Providencia huaxiensis]MCD2526857.1 hypothetical protein [Providencia huaxiensis]
MIYEIGTISTKANDPKITGKNTLWKNSVTKVSVGQIILIQSGNTIYQNSIRSVESDTQMTLSFPVPVVLTDVKYVISITMIGSVSDGVNKATAMVTESYQLMMILNRLMTESGVIKVVLPDGTEMQLRTEKERDRLLDGKFDKAGGVITRDGESITIRTTKKTQATIGFRGSDNELRGYIGNPNDSDRFAITNQKTSKSLALTESGKLTYGGTDVMLMGDFGFGGFGADRSFTEAEILAFVKDRSTVSQVLRNSNVTTSISYRFSPIIYSKSANTWAAFTADIFGGGVKVSAGDDGQANTYTLWTNKNTTKDSNGNLKAASPIIRVFSDHVDPNEEAKGVTLKKLHTGIYQLHGVLGLHSDASWGGINGGITIPCGINQLPLVYALYDVLEKGKPHPFDGRIVEPDEDGDIVLYTSYRQHDLPQNIQYERFKLYPEFLRDAVEGEESIPGFDGKVELTPGEPCDIPRGHWVDVRVNMPSNSIYNQKQAEAEILAKLEAERLAQEEAKRAAEEAERAEQEGQNEA